MTDETYSMIEMILHLTNDGDDLPTHDLQLVEDAANGFLDDKGMARFHELYACVKAGDREAAAGAQD